MFYVFVFDDVFFYVFVFDVPFLVHQTRDQIRAFFNRVSTMVLTYQQWYLDKSRSSCSAISGTKRHVTRDSKASRLRLSGISSPKTPEFLISYYRFLNQTVTRSVPFLRVDLNPPR